MIVNFLLLSKIGGMSLIPAVLFFVMLFILAKYDWFMQNHGVTICEYDKNLAVHRMVP